MARIETDPNYSSPTFSRSTAGTDLFKKEDVQKLAEAMSTHNHATGKGVAIAAGAIPNGLITSAMIADGTIGTDDLQNSLITYSKLQSGVIASATNVNGSTIDPTYSGGTATTIPEMTYDMSVPASAGTHILQVSFCGTFICTATGFALFLLAIGGVQTPICYRAISAAEVGLQFPVAMSFLAPVGAGSWTCRAMWAAQSGATVKRYGGNSNLTVTRITAP